MRPKQLILRQLILLQIYYNGKVFEFSLTQHNFPKTHIMLALWCDLLWILISTLYLKLLMIIFVIHRNCSVDVKTIPILWSNGHNYLWSWIKTNFKLAIYSWLYDSKNKKFCKFFMMIFGWESQKNHNDVEVAKFWVNGYTHLDEILYDHSYVGFIVANALPFNPWNK